MGPDMRMLMTPPLRRLISLMRMLMTPPLRRLLSLMRLLVLSCRVPPIGQSGHKTIRHDHMVS